MRVKAESGSWVRINKFLMEGADASSPDPALEYSTDGGATWTRYYWDVGPIPDPAGMYSTPVKCIDA